MSRFNSPLDYVRVAAPCHADWDLMIGNDRARFCGQCNLNVYNLSSMTKAEAESFIARSEGRLCVRFYRRKDGSILTENCPVGLREIRRKVQSIVKAMASTTLSFLAGLGVYEVNSRRIELVQKRTMGVMAREMGALPVMRIGPEATMGKALRQPEVGQLQLDGVTPISDQVKPRRKKGHASQR